MASSNTYRDGNSGLEQLQRASQRLREDNAVAANPAGPPALVRSLAPVRSATPAASNVTSRGLGAMVNGVRTFSDGSGSMAPTVSPSQMGAVAGISRGLAGPALENGTAPTLAASNVTSRGLGAMVNGVRTFSDGSGSMAPTVSPSQMGAVAGISRGLSGPAAPAWLSGASPTARQFPDGTPTPRDAAPMGGSATTAPYRPSPVIPPPTFGPSPAQALSASPQQGNPTVAPPATTPAVGAPPLTRTLDGSAPSAPQATSINGRPLGYGAMVNGVRTFSDGTGGPSAPAATMTRAQIDGLAAGRSLSRADAGIGGNIASEAVRLSRSPPGGGVLENTQGSYGAGAPSLYRPSAGGGQESTSMSYGTDAPMVTPPSGDGYGRARGDSIEAQRYAASDALHAAMRTPGSVAGDTAFAAQINAGSRLGSRALRQAEAVGSVQNRNAMAEAGVKAAADLGMAGLQDQGATTRTAMQGQNELTRAGMNNAAELQRTQLTRPAAPQIPMADGTLGLLGADNVVRPALGVNGQPVQPQRGKEPIDSTSYSKLVSENINRLLMDPQTGVQRSTTAAELQQATEAAREMADQALGSRPAQRGQGAGPPPEAAEFLRQNPQHREQFDKKYGAGASARLLGR